MSEQGVTGAKLAGDMQKLEKHEIALLANWKLVKDHKVYYKETFEMRMLRGLLKDDLQKPSLVYLDNGIIKFVGVASLDPGSIIGEKGLD